MMRQETKEWLDEQFQGQAETISVIWNEYLRSMLEKIESSRVALASSDCPQLDRLAHTMKGDALLVGDRLMAEAAIALRDASKASDVSAAAKAVERIAMLDQENRA